MKLYITESFNKKQLIKESLFFEYVNSDYDYDLTSRLIELLTTKTPIKLDSEYVNDKYNFDKVYNLILDIFNNMNEIDEEEIKTSFN